MTDFNCEEWLSMIRAEGVSSKHMVQIDQTVRAAYVQGQRDMNEVGIKEIQDWIDDCENCDDPSVTSPAFIRAGHILLSRLKAIIPTEATDA